MYLKSIEVQGFKSFANRIVLEFHNGITGIVGPNGSGKSNVADAVRWVLGEQSAKQLRGASMQDVIFAGTENRRPLSYAYVAITMDNSDHVLPVDYEEVTIARRVYRSGESEYLLNGSPCRLKDVNELFYDTGIGKEGYSIIGQGQIEKILSGKPEERRELFDEAVGIVKFKKRKATAIKKLEEERENLVRVNDILRELENRVGPLERQSETAKQYLKKKEELKTLDVNMYLLEMTRLSEQMEETEKKLEIAAHQYDDNQEATEKAKAEYALLEEKLREIEERIEKIHEEQGNAIDSRGKLENQINLLEEQIRSAKNSEDTIRVRKEALLKDKSGKEEEKEKLLKEKAELVATLEGVEARLNKAKKDYQDLEQSIVTYNETIEKNRQEIVRLLNEKATIKSKEQQMKTMLEQTNIRKSQLTQRLLKRKTEEEILKTTLEQAKEAYDASNQSYGDLRRSLDEIQNKLEDWRKKLRQETDELGNLKEKHQKADSRLESLKNIAERYDGYGNSIRQVMNQKDKNPGIIGVISDLIHVEKRYETAIETALGGNIQNIVTKDEETAKQMIHFLKQNRAGRATFLPLTAVKGKDHFKDKQHIFDEKGILGIASDLVEADEKFYEVIRYLLGRVVVAETVDDAIRLAKKNHYSLHIVTLEGEYLSPGGSMSGGAFKNSSNLLSRNREIEELQEKLDALREEMEKKQAHIEEMNVARSLLSDEQKEKQDALSEMALSRNTAKINLDRAKEEMDKSEASFAGLDQESRTIEREIQDIQAGSASVQKEMQDADLKESELQKQIDEMQVALDEKTYMETSVARNVSEIQIEEANAKQKVTFAEENLNRILSEIAKTEYEMKELLSRSGLTQEEIQKKREQIEKIKETIEAAGVASDKLSQELKDSIEKKEAMNSQHKGFFEKREALTKQATDLDREIMRLNNQKEKAKSAMDYQNHYMWEEYELTLRSARDLKDDSYTDPIAMKKLISSVKDEIRKMGNVNVNAIEEYKEVAERYGFMKTQHDDLIEAEKSLESIIEELDTGMREQFTKGFADIQREFDKAFKELFGGGKGTLELQEGEDVLETGIMINAQPPGKKLQNMMQMSGGEKSLTAIALLFAIQNLKPSPFCLLDEIEAALDDSNVDRYAKYLHKLTKNTQFIIITHRRGTMNAADRLYGITMQEKGVSTLVSVNLIENDLDA
ncbi:condensin subunit Smc [Lachnospiraceae bacterium A10]|nr:condensin subunit Smc [Lachnospiraceae bacterium A10]